MTPEELFNQHYRGLVNPVTPVIIEYGWLSESSAYELSSNHDRTLYGVVVLTDNLWDVEASGAFDDIVEARFHLSTLRLAMRNARPSLPM